MSLYARWARRERRESTRIVATALVGPVFLGLLPMLVARVGPRLDRRIGLRPWRLGGLNLILGLPVTAMGFALAFWSIDAQLGRGRGTPLPVMPTQALLTDGPFRLCRNPMTLGAILAYLGMAIAVGTRTGTAFVLAMAAALLAYLKRLEERELVERFGDAYLAYRREVPFILPRPGPRRRRP